MKKNVILLIALTGMIILSCEKETSNFTGITGKWNWLYSSGGFAGTTYTPESTGFKETVEFTIDSVYRLFRNDTLLSESGYHILNSNLVIYDNHSIRQSYSIKSDTLILADECYDCFISVFKRIE